MENRRTVPVNSSPPPIDLNWSVEERLRFVDSTLFWLDRINRSDLMNQFGISVPQASADLKRYQALAPDNIRYDTNARAYMTTGLYSPLFALPDADSWLFAQIGLHQPMSVDLVPVPARSLDPWLVRRFVKAIHRNLALQICYQDMVVPKPTWKWVAPTAFANDRTRWHVRAYNLEQERYEDLLFPRILQIGGEQGSGTLPRDEAWERFVKVRLRPAAHLTALQRKVIESDYNMKRGIAIIEVRAALLFLFIWRNGLNRPGALVEMANPKQIDLELNKLNKPFDTSVGSADSNVQNP